MSGQAADTPWGSLISLTLQADDIIDARRRQAEQAEANS